LVVLEETEHSQENGPEIDHQLLLSLSGQLLENEIVTRRWHANGVANNVSQYVDAIDDEGKMAGHIGHVHDQIRKAIRLYKLVHLSMI
jgi:hypothetical protein